MSRFSISQYTKHEGAQVHERNTTTSLIRSFNWREYLKQESARYTYKDLSAWEKEAEEGWKSVIWEQLAGYCCHWRWRKQSKAKSAGSLSTLEMARKEVPPVSSERIATLWSLIAAKWNITEFSSLQLEANKYVLFSAAHFIASSHGSYLKLMHFF